MHPNNQKFKHLIGKSAIIPILKRKIPIIADDYADPKKGSGAVKITPAHDFNDFEVGKKHDLDFINILDKKGNLNNNVPSELVGLNRFHARKKLIFELEKEGKIKNIEDNWNQISSMSGEFQQLDSDGNISIGKLEALHIQLHDYFYQG